MSIDILIHPAFWPQYTWTENWAGALPSLWGGGWVPIEHKVPWTEAYLHTEWHRDASSRLGTVEFAENWGGGSAPILGSILGPHLTPQDRLS